MNQSITFETQFDNEPIDQIPDSNKEYWCSPITKSTGFTYLMKLVLLTNKNPHLIDKIKNYKNEINKQNNNGWTALMLSCRNSNTKSNIQTVIELIQENADLNKQNDNGFTALMLSCRYSNTDSNIQIVKELIQRGADLNKQNNDGRTALSLSCRYSNTESNIETVKELIQRGADLNKQNNDGWTALMFSCRYSNTESNIRTVTELIKGDADCNKQNNNGWTALMLLCRYSNSNIQTVKELIKGGADCNKQSNDGWTALMLSRRYSNNGSTIQIVKELIKGGVDLNITELINFNNQEINDMLVMMYKNNIGKIKLLMPKLDNETVNDICKFNAYINDINKKIIVHKNNIYAKPGNIMFLCTEIAFNIKKDVKNTVKNEYTNISPKLKYLFDVKDETDMINKINFYL